MTFVGELDGEAFKVKTTNIFSQVKYADVPEERCESQSTLPTIKEIDDDGMSLKIHKTAEKQKTIKQVESHLFLDQEGSRPGFAWSETPDRKMKKSNSIVRVSSCQSFDDVRELNQRTESFVKS